MDDEDQDAIESWGFPLTQENQRVHGMMMNMAQLDSEDLNNSTNNRQNINLSSSSSSDDETGASKEQFKEEPDEDTSSADDRIRAPHSMMMMSMQKLDNQVLGSSNVSFSSDYDTSASNEKFKSELDEDAPSAADGLGGHLDPVMMMNMTQLVDTGMYSNMDLSTESDTGASKDGYKGELDEDKSLKMMEVFKSPHSMSLLGSDDCLDNSSDFDMGVTKEEFKQELDEDSSSADDRPSNALSKSSAIALLEDSDSDGDNREQLLFRALPAYGRNGKRRQSMPVRRYEAPLLADPMDDGEDEFEAFRIASKSYGSSLSSKQSRAPPTEKKEKFHEQGTKRNVESPPPILPVHSPSDKDDSDSMDRELYEDHSSGHSSPSEDDSEDFSDNDSDSLPALIFHHDPAGGGGGPPSPDLEVKADLNSKPRSMGFDLRKQLRKPLSRRNLFPQNQEDEMEHSGRRLSAMKYLHNQYPSFNTIRFATGMQSHVIRKTRQLDLQTGGLTLRVVSAQKITEYKEAMDPKNRLKRKFLNNPAVSLAGDAIAAGIDATPASPSFRLKRNRSFGASSDRSRRGGFSGMSSRPEASDEQYRITSKLHSIRGQIGSQQVNRGMVTAYLHWSFQTSTLLVLLTEAAGFWALIAFFAVIIYWAGINQPQCLVIAAMNSQLDFEEAGTNFQDAFAISWTTFSTVGYGIAFPRVRNPPNSGDNVSCALITTLISLESFVGILFASLCGAIIVGKITRAKSTASVIFSDSMVIRYGSGVMFSDGDEECNTEDLSVGSDEQHLTVFPSPVLEFRIINTMSDSFGGEILNATINVVATTLAEDLEEEVDDMATSRSLRRPTMVANDLKNLVTGFIGRSKRRINSMKSQKFSDSMLLPENESTEMDRSSDDGDRIAMEELGASTPDFQISNEEEPDLKSAKKSFFRSAGNISAEKDMESSEHNKQGRGLVSHVSRRMPSLHHMLSGKKNQQDEKKSDEEKSLENVLKKGNNQERRKALEKSSSALFSDKHSKKKTICVDGEGLEPRRVFSKLSIETDTHPFFKRVWIIRHKLTQDSPLLSPSARTMIRKNQGLWPKQLCTHKYIRKHLNFQQLIVSFSGTAYVTSSAVYGLKVYDFKKLYVGYTLSNILSVGKDGYLHVDFDGVHDIRPQRGGGEEPIDGAQQTNDSNGMTETSRSNIREAFEALKDEILSESFPARTGDGNDQNGSSAKDDSIRDSSSDLSEHHSVYSSTGSVSPEEPKAIKENSIHQLQQSKKEEGEDEEDRDGEHGHGDDGESEPHDGNADEIVLTLEKVDSDNEKTRREDDAQMSFLQDDSAGSTAMRYDPTRALSDIFLESEDFFNDDARRESFGLRRSLNRELSTLFECSSMSEMGSVASGSVTRGLRHSLFSVGSANFDLRSSFGSTNFDPRGSVGSAFDLRSSLGHARADSNLSRRSSAGIKAGTMIILESIDDIDYDSDSSMDAENDTKKSVDSERQSHVSV